MDFKTLALFALAVAPAIAIMVYIYSKDKVDREPLSVLIRSFLAGCLSVLPAIVLESFLPALVPGSSGSSLFSVAIYTFVIVAASEEFSKYIFLRYYAYKKPSFNEPFDGIVYAVMVGMGFATVENLMYVFGADTLIGQFGTAGFRAVTAVPAHATFAAVMGYYVGLAKFNRKNERSILFRGFLMATVLHGFYDFFLFQNLTWGLYAGALLSLVVGWRFTMKAIRLHKNNPRAGMDDVETSSTVNAPDESHDSPTKPS